MDNAARLLRCRIEEVLLEEKLLAAFSCEIVLVLQKAAQSSADMLIQLRRVERENQRKKEKVPNIGDLICDSSGISVTELKSLPDSCHINPVPMVLLLKRKIEKNIPIPKKLEIALEVGFIPGDITCCDKRHIKWQVAAQIMWLINPRAKTEEMKNVLLRSPIFFEVLEFDKLNCVDNFKSRFRAIEDKIRLVSPIRKRGRPRKDEPLVTKIRPLPAVYSEVTRRVHGESLYTAIYALAKILKLQKMSYEEIVNHPITRVYKTLSPTLCIFIDYWIKESLDEV